MFKFNLFQALLLIGALTFTSCGNDEPEIPDNGNGTEVPTPTPDKQEKNEVTVYADGSTSTGVPFRRINDTTFWLNYIKYTIVSGHIVVAEHDCIELEHTLHGEVEIYSAITIDDNKYPVRGISQWAWTNCVDYHTYDAPYCKNLKKITLPNSIVSFSRSLFSGCINLKEISLPNSITEIPVSCFNSCKSLEEIIIPDNVTSIGESAFKNCTSLKSIQLSKKLEDISEDCFYDCTSLKSIQFPESIKTLYYKDSYGIDDIGIYWEKQLRLIGYGNNLWIIRTWRERDENVAKSSYKYDIYISESMHPEDCIDSFENIVHSGLFSNFYHKGRPSSCDITDLVWCCATIYVPASTLDEYRTILTFDGSFKHNLKGYDPETFDFNSLLD